MSPNPRLLKKLNKRHLPSPKLPEVEENKEEISLQGDVYVCHWKKKYFFVFHEEKNRISVCLIVHPPISKYYILLFFIEEKFLKPFKNLLVVWKEKKDEFLWKKKKLPLQNISECFSVCKTLKKIYVINSFQENKIFLRTA